ncbi:cysteine peptidase family C39 domain-containing protein [Apibacter raozihei]|uniref:cysteine peptidase family C39 domain-containing protein n=1 Tax=Apibacter raozihei TaxID=2500547 RepID=UPI000FE2A374|nr:cysteine peptidase family C39 domain-containing protein [Apibacter raozihei]
MHYILRKKHDLAYQAFSFIFVETCSKGWNGFKHFIEKLLHGNTDEIVKTEGKVFDELGNLRDNTKSFFENAGIKFRKELSLKKVWGQTEEYTCAANSLGMLLDDLGIPRSEKYLADALHTDRIGANILDIPEALKNAYIDNVKTIARGHKGDKISVNALEKVMKTGNKKAVVSVWHEDFGAHAIVVDKIKNGRVYVRDPLPQFQGSSYSISLKDFEEVFYKKF